RKQYPASAKVFDTMADEEVRHRTMLFDLYRSKFGEYLPLIRRQDVKGFIQKKPLWLMQPLNLNEVRKYAEAMEFEAARFYRRAVPGRACRLGRRRHLDGICRSALGRRLAHRPRRAADPRHGLRRDDRDRRAWSQPALSYPRLLGSDRAGHHRSRDRARGDL